MLSKLKNAGSGIATQVRPSDEGKAEEPQEDSAMLSAAEDILSAIEAKDAGRLASAIRNAIEIAGDAPPMEGPQEMEGQE